MDTMCAPPMVPSSMLETIDYRLYAWAGHGVAEDAMYQYIEKEWMVPEEYDHLIDDPTDFMLRVYVPRAVGAFAGFSLGAGVIAGWFGQGFLATTAGWVVGLIMAIVFAWLAYAYYAVAVLIATASLGFAAGAALMAALGVTWNWLIILVAIVVAVGIGVAALTVNMPAVLLIVLSTLGGASVAVSGLMLVLGVLTIADLTDPAVTANPAHGWWWTVVYIVLAVLGVTVQTRKSRRWQRDAWAH